jgi:hypothetical protein
MITEEVRNCSVIMKMAVGGETSGARLARRLDNLERLPSEFRRPATHYASTPEEPRP